MKLVGAGGGEDLLGSASVLRADRWSVCCDT
jgi:hypothetical protein